MALFSGKVVVVTGAAQGIGLAAVERFINDGAYVLCVDHNPSVHAAVLPFGDKAVSLVADVSNSEDVSNIVATAQARWGRLDILCNNAGVNGRSAVLSDYAEEEFDAVIGVNLKGAFLCMKFAVPLMVAGGGGSIINISSVAGVVGMMKQSLYSSSKSGLIGMTQTAAIEFGPSHVRVNAVCPGGVLTPLSEMFLARPGVNLDSMLERVPLKRMAKPSEIASVVAFLASDDASFVTGAVIVADGGYTAG